MIEHPSELGFKLGLRVRIGEPASIAEVTDEAERAIDVVYVALLTESREPLNAGDAVKVGQTRDLVGRWRRTVGIFARANLRDNEKNDRRKLLEIASGKELSVWFRKAGRIEIPYTSGLTQSCVSTRCAEKEFLDQYYQPRFGQPLNRVVSEGSD